MEILKPSEVAKLLKVSLLTLKRWHDSGKLVAKILPNGRRFYTKNQITELIQGGN
jgi:predicted site-specific integrase-resolvase